MGLLSELIPKFKRRCEAIATERRQRLGLKAYEPLPADRLAAHLGASIVDLEAFPHLEEQFRILLESGDNWSASIVHEDPIRIVNNPNHTGARRESNLMHELAHILLKHPMVEFDTAGEPLRQKRYENEATYLGGCLQIPRRGLLWVTQKGMKPYQISQYFGASEEMVSLRCNATGIKI